MLIEKASTIKVFVKSKDFKKVKEPGACLLNLRTTRKNTTQL